MTEKNDDVRNQLWEIYKRKTAEYRVQMGYDEALPLHEGGSIDKARQRSLPKEDCETLWKEAAEGLELICAIGVDKFGDEYQFAAGTLSPIDPEYLSCMESQKLTTVRKLSNAVKRYLRRDEAMDHGLARTPFVYTILEEESLSDGEKAGAFDCFREMLDEEKELEDDPFFQEVRENLIRNLPAVLTDLCATSRGLNAGERAEFEKWFYRSR